MPRVAMIIFGLQALCCRSYERLPSLAPSKMNCCVELMGGCRSRCGGGLNMNELMRWRWGKWKRPWAVREEVVLVLLWTMDRTPESENKPFVLGKLFDLRDCST